MALQTVGSEFVERSTPESCPEYGPFQSAQRGRSSVALTMFVLYVPVWVVICARLALLVPVRLRSGLDVHLGWVSIQVDFKIRRFVVTV